MKRITFSLVLLSMLMIGASCSDNNENLNGMENGTGSLTITVKGQPSTRYVGDNTNTRPEEGVISNCTVLVFNFSSGDIEASKALTLTDNVLTGQIEGLNSGTGKRVVALVNVPTDLNLSNISTYNQIESKIITLDSQNEDNLNTTGFFMSGENTEEIQLVANGEQSVTIPVKRRVAKIVLKSLVINADLSTTPNFKITKVSVQKARINGNVCGPVIPPTGDAVDNYLGGIASPDGTIPNFSNTRTYLAENITFPDDYASGQDLIGSLADQKYFYVLPNDGSDGNGTMLTLSGTYGSAAEDVYYPFLINGAVGTGNVDGKFIEGNKVYMISVIMNNPGKPSEDPNTIPSDGSLNVTVTIEDWDATIDQTVEW